MLINVPVSDTVVLGDGVALWHLLVVLHRVLLLLAVSVREVLVGDMAFLPLRGPDLGGAFRPPDSIALNLGCVLTNPLSLGNTIFLENCITAFSCSGGVLDHIPEGDISTEVFLQSTFTNQRQRKESEDNGEETEGRHG